MKRLESVWMPYLYVRMYTWWCDSKTKTWVSELLLLSISNTFMFIISMIHEH